MHTMPSLATSPPKGLCVLLQMSHLAQLQYLLPDVISLEWVRLPVDPHSTRTEPHLAIALGPMPEQWERPAAAPTAAESQQQQQQGQAQRSGAAAAVAAAPAAAAATAAEAGLRSSKGPWGVAAGDADVPLLRQLLHYRLAEQLLGEYRQHLEAGAQKLRAAGEAAAAKEMEAQLLAIPASGSSGQTQQQPVRQFAAGFWETAPEVPQQRLPLRLETSSGVPSIAASPAAVSSHLAPLGTPRTATPAGEVRLPCRRFAMPCNRLSAFQGALLWCSMQCVICGKVNLLFRAKQPSMSCLPIQRTLI